MAKTVTYLGETFILEVGQGMLVDDGQNYRAKLTSTSQEARQPTLIPDTFEQTTLTTLEALMTLLKERGVKGID